MTQALDFAVIFQASSSAALAAWVVLILGPRPLWLINIMRHGLVGALAVVYGVLMALYFFRVPGGGYGSIEQVRALMMSDPVLTAGWIHYLAFDFFVGLWIAQRADQIGLSRWLQAPILALTFLFGPVGWLAFSACRAAMPFEASLRRQPS